MSITRYRALIDQLCTHLEATPPSGDHQSARFTHDGTGFTFFHGGMLVPDSVVLHCDFGEFPGHLPPPTRERILLRLLESNLYLFSEHAPGFTYDPARQRIVLMCRFGLAHADLASTLELMAFFSSMAKRWARDHFLFDTPST